MSYLSPFGTLTGSGRGERGYPGKNASIMIGSVQTIGANDPARVWNSGTVSDAVLNFAIPQGQAGTISGLGHFDDGILTSTNSNLSTTKDISNFLNDNTINTSKLKDISQSATANTIVQRDSNACISGNIVTGNVLQSTSTKSAQILGTDSDGNLIPSKTYNVNPVAQTLCLRDDAADLSVNHLFANYLRGYNLTNTTNTTLTSDTNGNIIKSPCDSVPFVTASRAPIASDFNYKIPTIWLDTTAKNLYILMSVVSNSATWKKISISSTTSTGENELEIESFDTLAVTNLNSKSGTSAINVNNSIAITGNITASTFLTASTINTDNITPPSGNVSLGGNVVISANKELLFSGATNKGVSIVLDDGRAVGTYRYGGIGEVGGNILYNTSYPTYAHLFNCSNSTGAVDIPIAQIKYGSGVMTDKISELTAGSGIVMANNVQMNGNLKINGSGEIQMGTGIVNDFSRIVMYDNRSVAANSYIATGTGTITGDGSYYPSWLSHISHVHDIVAPFKWVAPVSGVDTTEMCLNNKILQIDNIAGLTTTDINLQGNVIISGNNEIRMGGTSSVEDPSRILLYDGRASNSNNYLSIGSGVGTADYGINKSWYGMLFHGQNAGTPFKWQCYNSTSAVDETQMLLSNKTLQIDNFQSLTGTSVKCNSDFLCTNIKEKTAGAGTLINGIKIINQDIYPNVAANSINIHGNVLYDSDVSISNLGTGIVKASSSKLVSGTINDNELTSGVTTTSEASKIAKFDSNGALTATTIKISTIKEKSLNSGIILDSNVSLSSLTTAGFVKTSSVGLLTSTAKVDDSDLTSGTTITAENNKIVKIDPTGSITSNIIKTDTIQQKTAGNGVTINSSLNLPLLSNGILNVNNGIVTSQSSLENSIIPIGVIWMYSSASAPSGWCLCDGGTYTNRNGVSFTAPDLRDRFIMGSSSTHAVNSKGGSLTQTLAEENLPAHTHSCAVAGVHKHEFMVWGNGTYSNNPLAASADNGTTSFGSASTSFSEAHGHVIGSTGSGTAFSITPSYYCLTFIYKL